MDAARLSAFPPADRRAWLRATVAASLALGLGGCGFRLRGAIQLPFSSLRTSLSGAARSGAKLRVQLPPAACSCSARAGRPAAAAGRCRAHRADRAAQARRRRRHGHRPVRELQLRVRFKFRLRGGRAAT